MEIPRDTTVFRGSLEGWFQHQRPAPGVYLVHKPAGATSFSVVQQFQAALKAQPGRTLKVCHGGVLDPFASGLLVVLVGQATKLFEALHGAPKGYQATVRFGVETDTGDAGGVPTPGGAVPEPAARDAALKTLLGWQEQVPPATSNKRVDGERAWKKAHRGEAVELPPSRVYLHRAAFTAHAGADSALELECGGGFYVRSLARDVGRALGCGAHLATLTRTHLGPWRVPPPDELVALRGPALLPWLPSAVLDDAQWGRVRQGEALETVTLQPAAWRLPSGFPVPPDVRAFHLGKLVALLRRDARGWAAQLVLLGGV